MGENMIVALVESEKVKPISSFADYLKSEKECEGAE